MRQSIVITSYVALNLNMVSVKTGYFLLSD